MPTLMQSGATWLGAQLKASAGLSVVIQQGTRTVEGVIGWLSKNEALVADSEGFATSVTSFDWEFVTGDLPSDLDLRTGALITATIRGTAESYEVMPLGMKPSVEKKDTTGVMLVVHTKRVS